MASAILSVDLRRCSHFEGVKALKAFAHGRTVYDVWKTFHPAEAKGSETCFSGHKGNVKDSMELEGSLTVGDIQGFGIKYLVLTCTPDPELETFMEVVDQTTKKATNAFEVLMAGGRAFPTKRKQSSGMTSGLNRKDELFNDLCQLCVEQGLDFPKATAEQDGGYFVQILCNALWYITNQMETIDEAARRQKDVKAVPKPFDQFIGYNDFKRKKIKAQQMTVSALRGHANSIFSLLDKPYVNTSRGKWSEINPNIKALAECMSAYAVYLEKQGNVSQANSNLQAPVRTVDTHASVSHCKKADFLYERYKILDKAVVTSTDTPIMFSEELHVEQPFENAMQRLRFFQQLSLSVPVDLIRYTPGGGVGTTFVIAQVPEHRSEAEMMTSAARLVQSMRPQLKEYHTRAQKRLFKAKVSNVAKVQPALLDFIYSELALDASAAAHPDMQQRIRLISLGECGLVSDLRNLNPGRPGGTYDVFLQKLCDQVADITAADDRRHGQGVAHMSRWVSLSDMIEEVTRAYPEGTPIPSKSLVRLQFQPTNPYTQRALQFTSKVPIQYKIQRRQLRAQHQDDHYCAALFKYLRTKAVEVKNEAAFFCTDDKAKVPIGEPNKPISTGVRGRVSVAPAASEISSLDHDMNMASLTPSVVLKCSVPENSQRSFVRGQVTTIINDSVTQTASPFRHAVHLKNVLEQSESMPHILLKYTDGGTDQRNTLESVKIANICLFRELDLDFLVAARCAPGQSYVNPAERVMSILNYGLQNMATERQQSDEESEKIFKHCNSMATLREQIKKKPELAEKWKGSVAPVQALIKERFLKLKLKEDPVQVMNPVATADIDLLQRHMRELFPDLDVSKLQKVHTNKSAAYNEWKRKHCRETQYTFQIRKCDGEDGCCSPKSVQEEKLQWLPEPVLDETREHFLPYEAVRDRETDERDRPSLKVQKTGNGKKGPSSSGVTSSEELTVTTLDEQTPEHENTVNLKDVSLSGQNARATITCVECRKPRVVYSKIKLSQRKQVLLATAISEYEYTCGSSLFPPTASVELRKSTVIRPGLQCAAPVEVPYYVGEVGRRDICAHCGIPESETDPELKKMYKTVLPICQACRNEGKSPIVQRKYGK